MTNAIELPLLLSNDGNTVSEGKGSRLTHKAIFSQWMTEYEKLLRHLIIGFEAKPALQDELFQEIALNIWRALPSFRHESSVKTFVARIAHNVLATHVAKSVRTISTDENIDDHHVCEPDEQPISCPYQALDQQQRQKRLIQAIQSLPIDHQQVITLALEGMSYKEIAETLDISTNLVGVRLQRAKVALTEKLEIHS